MNRIANWRVAPKKKRTCLDSSKGGEEKIGASIYTSLQRTKRNNPRRIEPHKVVVYLGEQDQTKRKNLIKGHEI